MKQRHNMKRHFIIILLITAVQSAWNVHAEVTDRLNIVAAAAPTTVDDPVSFSAEAIDLSRIDLTWQIF
jgi:hypothetical protein